MGVSSVLEQVVADRGNEKRPDGFTNFPSHAGMCLVLDATSVVLFSLSHLVKSAVNTRKPASTTDNPKRRNTSPHVTHFFTHMWHWKSGAMSPDSIPFQNEVSKGLEQ